MALRFLPATLAMMLVCQPVPAQTPLKLSRHTCITPFTELVSLAWPWDRATHSLVGRMLDRSEARVECQMLDEATANAQLVRKMHGGRNGSRIVLFGEVHDNRWHHQLRAAALAAYPLLAPLSVTLIFEHIRADQAAALAPFNAGDLTKPDRGSAADLLVALEWDKSGWPDKAMFAPLFDAALKSGAKIAHGDPPRGLVRDVARRGLAALAPDEIARLNLDQPFPPTMQEALLTELEASHCGLMPKSAFANMAIAQRYRDAYMAAEILKARDAGSRVILFAGNGHVRESGVPYALSMMRPELKPTAIQFLEVEEGKTDPRDYGETGTLFFTPRAERKDPCEEMRAQFGKKAP